GTITPTVPHVDAGRARAMLTEVAEYARRARRTAGPERWMENAEAPAAPTVPAAYRGIFPNPTPRPAPGEPAPDGPAPDAPDGPAPDAPAPDGPDGPAPDAPDGPDGPPPDSPEQQEASAPPTTTEPPGPGSPAAPPAPGAVDEDSSGTPSQR